MNVSVRVVGHIVKLVPNLQQEYDNFAIPGGSSPEVVMKLLKIPEGLVASVLINGVKQEFSCALADGDKLVFIAPLAGG